jgi:ribose-phosphate pyrophosphokinase
MKKIVAGSSSQTLSHNLSKVLDIPIATSTVKRFPDGELYIRLHDEMNEAIIVQNTFPDENIVELMLLQDAVRRVGADTIYVVIPYYGYGRQDRIFEAGEAVSAAKLARLIQQDASMLITVDPHKEYITEFFDIPAYTCSAVNDLASFFVGRVDLVLAPDRGAMERAQAAATILSCPSDYLEKKRLSGDEVRMQPKELDVGGRSVLIIDDIISTGGTMAAAVKNLNEQGASDIYAACSHGLFTGNAVERMTAAGCTEIVATDTVESPYSTITAATTVAACL